MKKLLPLLIMAFIASCGPSRYLPCPKDVGHGRLRPDCADSVGRLSRHLSELMTMRKYNQGIGGELSASYPYYTAGARKSDTTSHSTIDTVTEWMYVSSRLPGFVVIRKALSVRIGGKCWRHLQCDGRAFKRPMVIGWCEGKERYLANLDMKFLEYSIKVLRLKLQLEKEGRAK